MTGYIGLGQTELLHTYFNSNLKSCLISLLCLILALIKLILFQINANEIQRFSDFPLSKKTLKGECKNSLWKVIILEMNALFASI